MYRLHLSIGVLIIICMLLVKGMHELCVDAVYHEHTKLWL